MARTGRPKIVIDVELVKRLAHTQCTYEEIASCVGCSARTLKDRFPDEIRQAREGGRKSLRRRQWKSAMSGSEKMMIHLGKQYLDQWEKIHEAVDGTVTIGVILDADFYTTAVGQRANAAPPSTGSASAPGKKQGSRVRKTMGKNGTGANGNGARPRRK